MIKLSHVLVVEDDQWLAQQHMRTLMAAGFSVDIAYNSLEAIDLIDTRRPDAIILDVLLAGPNAFTLLHELRSHADLVSIPVILCTNSADDLIAEDIATYGVRQVIDKTTMHPSDIVAAINRLKL